MARSVYINSAYGIYVAALKRAENERKEELAREQEEYFRKLKNEGEENPSLEKYKSSIVQQKLGSNVSMCTVLLQPYYPRKSFVDQLALKEIVQQIEVRGRWSSSFPSRNIETTPDGTLYFQWRRDNGALGCEQIFGHGLVYDSVDILSPDRETGIKQFYLSHVSRHICLVLFASRNYYRIVKYQGNITGYILLRDVEDLHIKGIMPHGWNGFSIDNHKCLLDKYRWDIDTDTAVLNNPHELQALILDLVRDIYVGLDMVPPQDKLLKAFLKAEGWLVQEEKEVTED